MIKDKLFDFCNDDAIYRATVHFAPSNKHIIINPRLPTSPPVDCIDEVFTSREPSIFIPGDIAQAELGRWIMWILRASVDTFRRKVKVHSQYFQGVPGLQALWAEKKRLQIPNIFNLEDPDADNRDFSLIPHRNAIMEWYVHLRIYASGDQILLLGNLGAPFMNGRVVIKDFDPFLSLSTGEEALGKKVLLWWQKFRDMEVDFSQLRLYPALSEDFTVDRAVRWFYERIFGYRFHGDLVIRPAPEDIPQHDPTDPLKRHDRKSKDKE